jgi:hypothetical protein
MAITDSDHLALVAELQLPHSPVRHIGRPPTCRETPDSKAAAERYLRIMDAPDDVAYYLAEWYVPELTEQSVDDVVAKLDAAAILVSSEGTPVRLVVTLAVPTDEVLYGVFGAGSSDTVTKTCLHAGVPHQRLSGDVGTRIREQPTHEVADRQAM